MSERESGDGLPRGPGALLSPRETCCKALAVLLSCEMKRARDDEAAATSITEASVHMHAFRTHKARLRALFQQRWADFHVRELGTDGSPVSLPPAAAAPLEAAPAPASSDAEPTVLHFVMAKENRTTADALQQLSQTASCHLGAFGVTGAKDRRAVTVQRVSAKGISAERLLRINDKWKGSGANGRIRIAGLERASKPLSLSDSRGNAFVVVLREVALLREAAAGAANAHADGAAIGGTAIGDAATDEATADELAAHCGAVIEAVRHWGFVNYFGLQRFGNNAEVPTQLVGVAMLRRDFLAALRLVLHPSTPGLKQTARVTYVTHVRV